MILDEQKLTAFLDELLQCIAQDDIDVSDLELDHVCYRVETQERYLALKTELSKTHDLLAETLINARPICSFKLATPLGYQNRKITVLELPSPKEGSPYNEGFEHVEFVLKEPLHVFIKKYPQLDFDLKGMRKKVNADVRLQYDCGSVKFHEQSLEYVIKYLD